MATLKPTLLAARPSAALDWLTTRASTAFETGPQRGKALIEPLIATFAQVVFSRRSAVGWLVFAAAATQPTCLGFGLAAVVGARAGVRGLKLPDAYTPYGYNALLAGVALGHEYGFSLLGFAFALALGLLSVVVTAALSTLATQLGFLPVLALPFVVTSWFGLGVALQLPLRGLLPQVDPWLDVLPPLAANALQSFGALLWIPKVSAGCLVLLALLVHSRIASLLAMTATLLVLWLLQLAHAPLSTTVVHSLGVNAALTAMALGGVFLVPSRGSSLLALAGALLAAFFTLGSAVPLTRLGVWPAFLPYCATVVFVLSTLRQRSEAKDMKLAEVLADTPEQLLLDDIARSTASPASLWLTPPFYGAWTCTQGADGPYTHRGSLRHAYDFEIYDEQSGSLCRSSGLRAEDYHCFAQPVIAVAEGTVVSVESSLPNCPVGDADVQRPWGNYVMVEHANKLFSVVAHLSPGTVTVWPGQYVTRGTVLGYCGNSGFSPRPHLHFQLQGSALMGAPTIPSRFRELVVRTGPDVRYESLHEPQQGETMHAMVPDYAFAALFDLPLGTKLVYRMDGELEHITCESDVWGRTLLRSEERSTELLFTRTAYAWMAGELHGDTGSVLRLWRLALGSVPFERRPTLTFKNRLPERWLSPGLSEWVWDVRAAVADIAVLELRSHIAPEGDGLAVVGTSTAKRRDGQPRLTTRARVGHGTGPSRIEVQADGKTRVAELVPTGGPEQLVAEGSMRSALSHPFGLGHGS